MNFLISKSKFSLNYNWIIVIAFFIVLPLITSFTKSPQHIPAKIKFTSMLMSKVSLTNYHQNPKFSYFLFQNANLDVGLGRNSFELIVYAYDTAGMQMNPNIRLLSPARLQPNPPVNERSDNIYFGNYFLPKDQYQRIVDTYDTFENLKFVAESINSPETYGNYITYKIIPVSGTNETPVKRVKTGIMLIGDDYMKPSPPAPPEAGDN